MNDKDVMLVYADGNNTLVYKITGLKPWSKYDIRVAAVTVAIGPWSEWKMSMTMEDGMYVEIDKNYGRCAQV